MKFNILSKKGAAIALSVMLAVGSFAVSAAELLGGANFATATFEGMANGASGASGGSGGSGETVAVNGVTLTESLSLVVGDEETLTATVAPLNASNKNVTWSSNNEPVATVDANGKVEAKTVGTAVITVTTTDGGFTAQCTVTVSAATVAVTGVTMSSALTMNTGSTQTLTATVLPSNATNKAVTWSSNNTSVASVVNGVVTAHKAGTATITVTSASNSNAKATCVVTVNDVAVTSVNLSASTATIVKGDNQTLTATIAPANATVKTITWSTSDSKVATVSNGKVTAKAAGTATITATAANGVKGTCKVTVADVTLNASTIAVQVGKTTNALKVATKSPSNDTVKTWASSDKKIATVTSKGVIKGIKKGSATITVTMKSGAKATCKVTVQTAKVVTKSLKISDSKLTVLTGKKATLTVARNPISATEKITWSSSNSKVATVDSKGVVTAKKAGTVKITAKSSNGKNVKCTVTVKNASITLKSTKATIKVGKTATIKVKGTFPANDTIKSYKSSNTKVATVSNKGVVTGKKAGTAKITVTTKSGAKATYTVTVKK